MVVVEVSLTLCSISILFLYNEWWFDEVQKQRGTWRATIICHAARTILLA